MPDISFVAGDDGGGNVLDINTATNKLTWPSSGLAVNDIALIFWAMQNTATPTIPGGWNVDTAVDMTSGSGRVRFMWKPVDPASDTGDISLTNSSSLINRQSAVLAVYRGVDPDSPFDATTTIQQGTSGTSQAAPSITTGSADSRVGTCIAERATSITTNWTAPGSYTERDDSTTDATGSGGTIVAIADDGLAVARKAGTAVSPGSWASNSGTASANRVALSFSLRPQRFRGWGVPIR